MIPARQFLRMCRRCAKKLKVADSSGMELTGERLLTAALLFRRLLRRHVLADDERTVGILFPPSVAASVVNATVAIDGRTAVNLNYTVTSPIMNYCCKNAEVRHVLTSRKVMERFSFEIDAEFVFVEDLKEKATAWDKVASVLTAKFASIESLEKSFGLDRIDPDDVMTIIYTSGSTGDPKGVMLTHRNIASNLESFASALDIRDDDVVLGILPPFHSYGYTCTLWDVLTMGAQGVYHFSPLEARPVGKLATKYGGTMLVATPTFLRTYLKRCEKEDFATTELVVTGAERLPKPLADAFEAKFGHRPLEGYGMTEFSPVVSVNIPPSRSKQGLTDGLREGSVGRPLPGVDAKAIHMETGRDLGPNEIGMLCYRGESVMKGYLKLPEKTAEVIRDGWYVSGDVGKVDEDGFIFITGRESRFSKIGGEMVPHVRIEEAINQVLAREEDEPVCVAVTAVEDERKGERVIVLHTELRMTPSEIRERLREAGLPQLWIPSQDAFCRVEEIPVLGTGKLDLRAVRETAQTLAAGQAIE